MLLWRILCPDRDLNSHSTADKHKVWVLWIEPWRNQTSRPRHATVMEDEKWPTTVLVSENSRKAGFMGFFFKYKLFYFSTFLLPEKQVLLHLVPTIASAISHSSSQIVPHSPLCMISTLPSLNDSPSTKRTSPLNTIHKNNIVFQRIIFLWSAYIALKLQFQGRLGQFIISCCH